MLRRKRRNTDLDENEEQVSTTTSSSTIRKSSTSSPVIRSKSRNNDDDVETDSIFCEFVTQAGVKLKTNIPHQLDVDQAIFQRDLKKLLRNHPRPSSIIEEFVDSMKKYFLQSSRLESCLMPTDVSTLCTSARGDQDSLVRILLGIDILQAALIPCLLEKAAEFSVMQGKDDSFGAKVPLLILSQLRWLGVLVDSKCLADKMLEILPVLSLQLQKTMILLFPEILHDSEHSGIARKLSEMMYDNKNLILVIAESLATLNIEAEDVAEVKLNVLKMIQTVPLEEIPTLIYFLFNNVLPEQANQIVSELRTKLDLVTSLIPLCTSTPTNNVSVGRENKANGVHIMEAVRSACSWQKLLCETWIKKIEKISDSKDHLPLDVVVLVLLYSLELRRKSIETLFRNKIRERQFTILLLSNTIRTHSEIMKKQFSSIVRLAHVLLKSFEPNISKFGSAIYQNLFVELDSYCQKEVIGELMTHIGSGVPSEVDAALEILQSLVQDHKEKMVPYASFLKSLLDYLDYKSLDQARSIYSVLSELAYRGGAEGAMVQNELRIVITKQVTHSDIKYKRMGVMGALMATKAMSTPRSQESQTRLSAASALLRNESYAGPSSSQSFNKTLSRDTIQLLNLVKQSAAKSSEITALFCDELSRLILKGLIDDKVESWINGEMINSFQEDFITDVNPEESLNRVGGISFQLWQNLEGDAEEQLIAVNLGPLVIQEDPGVPLSTQETRGFAKVSPITLSAQFRLLRICEHFQHSGNLEGLDALVGCPIILPKWDLATFSKQPVEHRKIVCTAIVHCINWYREVLNAFVSQTDEDTKGKVVQRLRNIVQMQDLLRKILAETPDLVFPMAVFDYPDLQVPTTARPKRKPSPGRKTTKLSKKKCKVTDNEANTQATNTQKNKDTQLNIPTTQNEDKSSESKNPPVDLSIYRACFRELDMDVFNLLTNGLNVSTNDSQSSAEKKLTSLKLGPAELLFLLEDLTLKADHGLPSSSVKRFSALRVRGSKQAGFCNLLLYKAQELAQNLVNLFPSFCSLLEECSAYFQNIVDENDGVMDGPGMDSENSNVIGSCMALIFKTMNTTLSWSSLQDEENLAMFQGALRVLASRLTSSQSTQCPLKENLKQAFHYLNKYMPSLGSLDCGVALLKLLETLASFSKMETSFLNKVSLSAKSLLTRAWPNNNNLKGVKHNDSIQTLLGIYITNGERIIGCLETIATVAIPELVKDENKEGASATFPTLTKHTFGTYHRIMLIQLVELIKNIDSLEPSEIIEQWEEAVNIFQIVVNIVKIFDARKNLASCLMYGRPFVDSFNRQCMPLLDKKLSVKMEDTMRLIKSLQTSTRYMQHICAHAKAIKDVSLTKHVPLTKKTLEMFVFRVKEMLARNNCKEAFWMGNLKNRDLHGEEILSQVSEPASDDESADNEVDDARSVMEEDEKDSDDAAEVQESQEY